MASKESGVVRYAVVGAGNIAQVAVLPAFRHAKENSALVAVISGDEAKRAALKKRYRLEFDGDYHEFEDVLDRADVQAVYIATPNALHKDFAVRAAARGVHVLCEKPLAPSVEDCRAIENACARAGVRLMVAYRLHFEQAHLEAIEIARSGRLGEPRLFSSFFAHVVRPDDLRRDAELAGGAALDMGVYCINAARHLFAAEPNSVFANVVERDGTDDTTTVTMTFPGERVAQFCVSNSVAGVSTFRIAGELGDLRMEPAFEYAEGNDHYLTVDGKTRHHAFTKRDQFAPELIYFSRCILNGEEPEPSGEEGIADVRVVEAIFESARTGTKVLLPPFERRVRPGLELEIHKPPIKKPATVHAPSPSTR